MPATNQHRFEGIVGNTANPAFLTVCMAYERIFSGGEKNASFNVLSTLRNAYPDHHVTCIDIDDCNLLQFADAGHAKYTLLDGTEIRRKYTPAPRLNTPRFTSDTENDNALVDSAWDHPCKPKGGRAVDGEESDKLEDVVQFGMYSYHWNDQDFLVFSHLYEKEFPRIRRRHFILSLRSTGMTSDGMHSLQTDELIRTVGRWQAVLHNEIYVFDDGRWTKNKSLWHSMRSVSWDDVILDSQTKESLIDDVQGFFASQALYTEFAIPWKRGVILHGVPGNGKTISIKALMNSLYASSSEPGGSNRPVSSLYVKSLQTCYGEQYAVASIFKWARLCAPCMLIFEDLDSLVTEKVRSYFLNELDGLETNDGLFLIGSTNHLGKLDQAITNRPSRFDRKYLFALPEFQERLEYGKYWRRKLKGNERVDFPEKVCELMAEWTSGFSFAYLKELFISSLLVVAKGVVIKPDHSSRTASGAETKPKIELSDMEVPDELKNNSLLQALRLQIRALLLEMDTSKTAIAKLEGTTANTTTTAAEDDGQ